MSANDITAVAIEKEQENFVMERRLNILSLMEIRQHGSPRDRPGSLGFAHKILTYPFRGDDYTRK